MSTHDIVCFTCWRRGHIAKNCRANIAKEGPSSESKDSNRQPALINIVSKCPYIKRSPTTITTVPKPLVDEQQTEADENTDNVNFSDSDETPTASQTAGKNLKKRENVLA